ncbi:hypothetical protein O181_025393 [Austropuccinia psidii MF-1]|uniref:Uncharacterized protein n=1 Tax=Austropuccinia psidii MF-1 TaxID=1389203 RepID=A0A9Q3GZ26_9BASI|nr:hypothetical protein [Austropuccinia psidii MF-1]
MDHTTHLAAHDGLRTLGSDTSDTITPVDHEDLNPMSISRFIEPPNGLKLKYSSFIGKISKLDSYLYHSLQRRGKLIKTINLVYDTDKPTNSKTLLLKVPTQWNSTYNMLNRASDLKDAYDHFCTPNFLASYRLSHLELEKAKVMVLFFQPRYEATLLIYLEKYDVSPIEPAANVMIQKISKYITIIFGKRPLICASILKPRLKYTFFLTNDSTLGELRALCTQLAKMFEEGVQMFVPIQDCKPHEIVVERSTPLLDRMYPLATHKG